MNRLFSRNDNILRTLLPIGGGPMSAVHFGDAAAPIKLVFLNANGFHGLAYRSILEPLGLHTIGLDLRGHGFTRLPADKNFASFHTYAKDVVEYLKNHINGSIILAGHSLGASAAILAAEMAPDKISRVLAFDPIVLPLYVRLIMARKFGRAYLQKNYPIAKNAGRRRNEFDSLKAAYERFHGRGPFKSFPDEALWDYVCGGFVQEADHVRLACRPKWEQFTYTAQSHNLKSSIAKLPDGSKLLITDFVKQGKWIGPMQRARPELDLHHRPELDHFFPIINPEVSIPALKDILGL